MPDTLSQADRDYRANVLHATLEAIVKARAAEGAEGGLVDLPGVTDGVCSALATIIIKSGQYTTPRDRLLYAEECGKKIKRALDGIAAMAEQGMLDDFRVEQVGLGIELGPPFPI